MAERFKKYGVVVTDKLVRTPVTSVQLNQLGHLTITKERTGFLSSMLLCLLGVISLWCGMSQSGPQMTIGALMVFFGFCFAVIGALLFANGFRARNVLMAGSTVLLKSSVRQHLVDVKSGIEGVIDSLD